MFWAVESVGAVSGGTGVQPVITSVSAATTTSGTCVGSTCTVSGAATATVVCGAVNDTYYTLKLYENGVLVKTGTTAGYTYKHTFAGYSQSGGSPFINPSLIYRADLVLISSGTVVQTVTATTYTDTFGTCGGSQ